MNGKHFFFAAFLVLIIGSVYAAVPTVTSTTHPEKEWSSERFIKVSFSYSGATNFAYVVDKEEDTIPGIDGNSSEFAVPGDMPLNLGSKLDGIWFLHVRAKNSSGWSDTKHFEFRIDSNGPERPEFLNATQLENGDVKVEWGDAIDDLSGIDYYDVYRSNLRFVKDGELSREFSVRDAVAKLVGPKIKGNSFVDDTVQEGFRYHYKIQSVDVAGNLGRQSNVASVQAPSFCDIEPRLQFELKGTKLNIMVDATQNFKRGHLSIFSPDGQESVLVDSESNVASIDANFSFANKQSGDYNVTFTSIDDDSDNCAVSGIFVYDSEPPTARILSPVPTAGVLKELVTFEIEAIDPGVDATGIEGVSLYLVTSEGEELVAEAVKQGDKYVYDWNTINYDNGRFEVVARARDRGGNTADDKAVYTFENTFFARIQARSDIDALEGQRTQTMNYMADLAKKGIDILDLNNAVNNADSNYDYANELFSQGIHYELASSQAKKSSAMYSGIRNRITTTNYGSNVYVYNLEQLDIFLGASGLDSSIVKESKGLIVETQPSRKLDLVRVTQDGLTYYRANVTISFTNPRDENMSVKVLETIPKRFIDNAEKIISQKSFEIVQADPIIVFDGIIVEPGQSVVVNYALNERLSQEQVDALKAANVMGLYLSPPMVLNSTTDLSAVRLSSFLNFTSVVSSLPAIEFNTTNLIIIGVAVVAVFLLLLLMALLVVFGVYMFFIKKRR